MTAVFSKVVQSQNVPVLVSVLGILSILPEPLLGAGKTLARQGWVCEGSFELGKKIPLDLKPLTDPAGREVRFEWVEFRKSGDKVLTTVHVERSPDFQAEWAFKFRFLDTSGKIVSGSYPGFTSTDKNRQKELAEGKDLRLEFEPAKNSKPVKFQMEINPPETRVYDMNDIIQSMQRYQLAGSPSEATAKILAGIRKKLKTNPEVGETLDLWKEHWLIAYQTPENHKRLEKTLEDFRKRYEKQVSLELRFISCSSAEEKQLLKRLPEGTPAHMKPGYDNARFLSRKEAEQFLKGTQDIKSSQIIQSPRVIGIFDNPFIISVGDVSNPALAQKGGISKVAFEGKAVLSRDGKMIQLRGNVAAFGEKAAVVADIPDRQTLIFRIPFTKGRNYLYLMIKSVLIIREEVEPGIPFKKEGIPGKPKRNP